MTRLRPDENAARRVVRVARSGTPRGEHTTLVAQTGWGQEEDRNRAKDAGFDHHLTKPIALAALRKLLAGLKPNGNG